MRRSPRKTRSVAFATTPDVTLSSLVTPIHPIVLRRKAGNTIGQPFRGNGCGQPWGQRVARQPVAASKCGNRCMVAVARQPQPPFATVALFGGQHVAVALVVAGQRGNRKPLLG